MLLRFILILFVGVFSSIHVNAQRGFEAKAFTGITFSQIQGDFLAGFDKLGLNAGLQVQYPFTEKIFIGLELAYTQKGSRGNLIFNVPPDPKRTHLQYFEIPIIFEVKDWKVDEYYKIGIEGGIALSYLYRAESTIINLDEEVIDASGFSQFEYSALFGVAYSITKRLNLLLRYNRGLNKFYKSSRVNTGGLLNYYWTCRTEYVF